MKGLKTDVSEVLGFSLAYYLMMDLSKIDGYNKGFLNIKGDVIKNPKTKKEQEYVNPYMRMILKIRHMCRGRNHEIFDLLTLKTIDDSTAANVVNSLKRNAVNKQALIMFDDLLKNNKIDLGAK